MLCLSRRSVALRTANRLGESRAWAKTLVPPTSRAPRHVPRSRRVQKKKQNPGVRLLRLRQWFSHLPLLDPDASPPLESDFDRSADPIDFISSQEKSPPRNQPRPAATANPTKRVAQPPPFGRKLDSATGDKPKLVSKTATSSKPTRTTRKNRIESEESDESSSSRPATRSKTSSATSLQLPSSQPPSSQEHDVPAKSGMSVRSAPRLPLTHPMQSPNRLPLHSRPPIALE